MTTDERIQALDDAMGIIVDAYSTMTEFSPEWELTQRIFSRLADEMVAINPGY